MRLMVTGGAGYIGSVVAAQLVAAGHDVAIVDDLSTGHADAVPAGARLHLIDLADPGDTAALDELLAQSPFDAVLHFAARSVVGESVIAPAQYWHNNVGGALALFEAVRRHGVPRIVFSSSAATYGEPSTTPVQESAAARPGNPYGATKLAIDLALADYATAYGLTAVSLRYFNVAGALHQTGGVSFGERHATETHLIPLALRAAAGESGPLQVFGDDYPTADGTCIRDYVHVVDLARAHVAALSIRATPGAGHHQVINLGSGRGYSVREVIDTVEAITGRTVPVAPAARRPGDPAVLVASHSKAVDLLGWAPQRDLREMVRDAWTFHLGA